MKCLGFLTAALFTVACSPAGAAILAFDNFDYPDGDLVGNGGWAITGGSGPLQVVSGQAVVEHGVPAEDVNLPFTGVAGDIYYGIDFSVDDPGAPIPGTDNEYFAHFKTGGFAFSARLDVVPALGGGDFSVGISSDGSTADAIWASDLTYGTTYRAVVKYDQVANIATLWIDAAVPGDPSIVGDDQTDPGDSVVQFALRQSDSDLNETVRVDNLVVGMSFDDVVTAVPEPSTILMVLMMASAAGAVRLRSKLG